MSFYLVEDDIAPFSLRGDDDDSLDHYYCCDDQIALCGTDLSDAEDRDFPDAGPTVCVVCESLTVCSRCGEKLDA